MSRTGRLVVSAVAAAVLVVAVVAYRSGGDPPSAPQTQREFDGPGFPSTSVVAEGGPGPATSVVVIDPPEVMESPAAQPTWDWPRTEDGARRAAVGLLELTEDVVRLSPSEAASVQRSVSTAGSADRLAGEVEAVMGQLLAAAPGGVEVWVAPIAARSTETVTGWEVSIWHAQVIAYGAERVVGVWQTATYTLEWEAGGWKVADMVSVDGPVPVAGATTVAAPTAAELAVQLAGYDDADLVASPEAPRR